MGSGVDEARDVGKPRAGACPSPLNDPLLACIEPIFRVNVVFVFVLSVLGASCRGTVEGGGEGDDSTHSSPRSSVCHPGAANAILCESLYVLAGRPGE